MNFSTGLFRFFNTLIVCALFAGCALQSFAKGTQAPFSRVDPPNWWVGMENNTVELLFQGPSIQEFEITLAGTDTKITKISRPSNPYYVFVTIEISKNQKAGEVVFQFTGKKKKKYLYKYQLYQKNQTLQRGIDPSDLIYLVFPDRFANGDTTNDRIASMNEPQVDRKGLKTRHGGDIQGIIVQMRKQC
jgi:hypothetical protein